MTASPTNRYPKQTTHRTGRDWAVLPASCFADAEYEYDKHKPFIEWHAIYSIDTSISQRFFGVTSRQSAPTDDPKSPGSCERTYPCSAPVHLFSNNIKSDLIYERRTISNTVDSVHTGHRFKFHTRGGGEDAALREQRLFFARFQPATFHVSIKISDIFLRHPT